jgi:hypothetical protein
MGFAWLVTVGSGLDDWIYWHFFTITISYGQLIINDCLQLTPFLTEPRASSRSLWQMMSDESLLTLWILLQMNLWLIYNFQVTQI